MTAVFLTFGALFVRSRVVSMNWSAELVAPSMVVWPSLCCGSPNLLCVLDEFVYVHTGCYFVLRRVCIGISIGAYAGTNDGTIEGANTGTNIGTNIGTNTGTNIGTINTLLICDISGLFGGHRVNCRCGWG